MRRFAPLVVVALALVAVAAAAACGRTDFDEWTDGTAGPGTGGRGGGTGGRRGGSGGFSGFGGAGGFSLPPTPGVLLCGTEICLSDVQSCCIGASSGGGATARCTTAGAACAGGVSLSCDEPADCSTGEICCAGLNPVAGSALITSRCVARNACAGLTQLVVCRRNSDCPATVPVCCSDLGVPVCQSRCGR